MPGDPLDPPLDGLPGVELDAVQLRAVGTRGACVLLGAPGTGKTTAVAAWAAHRLRRAEAAGTALPGAGAVVVVPSRLAAARLRGRLTAAAGGTAVDPVVRTPHSLAWAVLREDALRAGLAPPRLVTGAEADLALAEQLAGHEAGDAPGPRWPATVPPEVRRLRAFRTDLRELWSRLVERGYGPGDLADLGRRHDRPEWVAAAAVVRERLRLAGLSGDNGWDPAEIVDAAAAALGHDAGLLAWARTRVPHLAVDDAQDLTAAGLRLVRALGGGGGDVLVAGDPDVATQTFRGARPAAFEDPGAFVRGGPADVLVLPTAWRASGVPAAAARRVVGRAGVVTARHRDPAPVRPGGTARVLVLRDAAEEGRTVVAALRAWHHDPGTALPWSALAVVVRSAARVEALRRACAAAGVPVVVPGAGRPVRDEPAARLLLAAVSAAARPAALDAGLLRELVCGPLGGADALRWRALLRAAGPASPPAHGRAAGEALAATARHALAGGASPGAAGWDVPARLAAPLERVLHVLLAARRELEAGDRPEHVLWAAWQASGLAGRWRGLALGRGPDAAAADADLDAVLGLFDAARRFAARHPRAGTAAFHEHVLAVSVAEDRLREREDPAPDAVTITTPAGAVGREWAAVAVAGVQEGVWPDLRVRGSILGTADLVDLLDGRAGAGPAGRDPGARTDQARQTLDDEVRLFHVAVTRTRDHLLVTAVDGDDQRPSELCRLVAGPGAELTAAALGPLAAWHEHSLPSVVVALRRILGAGAPTVPAGLPPAPSPATAARLLARLSAAGVPGADPGGWRWLPPPGAGGPAAPVTARVRPSAVGRFLACPLRWHLEDVARPDGDEALRLLGDVVHEAARRHPGGTADEVMAVVDAAWDSLGVPPGWQDERMRRRAEAMAARLAGWARGRDAPLGVEVPFEVEVGGVALRGTIDRVEDAGDGAARVVDLKTGTPRSQAEALEDPQLAVYQAAVDAGAVAPGRRSGGAVLVHLGGTARGAAERPQPAPDQAARDRIAGQVAEMAAAMAAASFPAAPGADCARCAVRTSCPADASSALPPAAAASPEGGA